jgi:putative nucleotidyltransferase with HDIG domain
MDSPRIVISGRTPALQGQLWSSESLLRIGRLKNFEVLLEHPSISRRHAEVCLTEVGWLARDLGSSNGTFVNGVRIGRTGHRLHKGDVLDLGEVSLKVELLQAETATRIKTAGGYVTVQAAAQRSWEQALDGLTPSDEQWSRQGKQFLALLRAGYRICQARSLDESLQGVLEDTVAFFQAQRGGILLADEATDQLVVRSVAVARRPSSPGRSLSKTLARRAYRLGQSLLYRDSDADQELQCAQSVAYNSMSSIICALLRSPERPLGVLHLDRGPTQERFTEADFYLADSLAAALSLGVDRVQLVEGQQAQFLHTITALAQAVEMRDHYTGNHTHRVTALALLLAEELGLAPADRRLLQVAAPLHDIGKIAIDDKVLRKPGRLSSEEFSHMKSHVLSGVDIVQMIPGLAAALPIIRSHHERWDGTGYPDGLAGENIPRLARVVAVVDAFDAMTSDRPYRRGIPLAQAFAELEAHAGTHFDPTCVAAFLRLRPRLEAMFAQEANLQELEATTEETLPHGELARQGTPAPAPSAP